MTKIQFKTLLIALGLMGGFPAASVAQEIELMPELMLLVDTSGSMQQSDNSVHSYPGGVPSCLNGFDNATSRLRSAKNNGAFEFTLSRLSILQRALAGTPKGTLGAEKESPWCARTAIETESYGLGEHQQDRTALQNEPQNSTIKADAFPNCSERDRARDLRPNELPQGNDDVCPTPVALDYREACCKRFVGASCREWVACSAHLTRKDGLGLDESAVFNRDGIIHDFETNVLFGLMSIDADPAADGQASFGETFNGLNVGAVGRVAADSQASGALLPSNHGFIRPNDGAYSGGSFDLIQDNVVNHNGVVRERLRGMRAFGRSPLSAQLDDLNHYYSCQKRGGGDCQGIAVDPQFACRERAAIVISDGKESGPRTGQGYVLNRVAQFAASAREEYGARIFMIIMGRQGVADETISAELSVGLDGKVYRAHDEASLRIARNRIIGALGPSRDSRVLPLVYTPSQGDDFGESVRQLRISAYGEESDGVAYGRLEVNGFGCPAVLPDEDGRLRFLPAESYEASMRFRGQAEVTVVAENPAAKGESFIALGNGNAVFDSGGIARDVPDLQLSEFENLSDSGANGQVRRSQVFDGLSAYFGPAGESRDFRQLGAFVHGALLGIGPPNGQIDGLAFQNFRRERAERPGLVVSGARDGRVQFFRLVKGQQFLSFVPRLAWPSIGRGVDDVEAFQEVDGFLASREMAVCRSLGEDGPPECPSGLDALEFKTVVVGTMGPGGRNIFGVDLSEAHRFLTDNPDRNLKADDVPSWNLVNTGNTELARVTAFTDETGTVENLGRAVSRPFLTYAGIVENFEPRVVPVAVIGCGEGNSGRVGQCVAVINAVTGQVLKVFNPPEMDAPMVGSPVGYPNGGLATAQLIYIGDAKGRMWRLDLRETNPIFWSASIAWPIADDQPDPGLIIPGEYQLGRAITGRPALSRAPDGKPIVVFGTSGDVTGNNDRNFVVSFTDELTADEQGQLVYKAKKNWVFPLRQDESVTVNPVVRASIAYFTTLQQVPAGVCDRPSGRLYAMHYSRTIESYESEDGRILDVDPGFPILRTETGQQVTDALALRLPAGTVPFGMTIVNSPSCLEAEEATAEVILNVASSSSGGGGDAGKTEIERKSGQDADSPLDAETIKDANSLISVSLQGELPAGDNGDASKGDLAAPFPRRVLYWGSSFVR